MLTLGSSFGDYRIEKVLGSGTMGVVYKALDNRLDREVALKLIDDRISKSPEYRARLAQEAKAAAKIDSPYVVKVWEHSEFQGQPYISFEYISGEVLRTILESCDFSKQIDLARQIAQGLIAAHSQGLIHQDLKPENIKVTREGQVKILDFGLAKTVRSESVDQQGNVEGTLYYLSPEQLAGEPLTFSSDIFSYGVVLYELFTGKRPFEGEYPAAIMYSILHENPSPPLHVNKELPDWLDEYILKLLAKQPADRYENLQSALDYFENCLRGKTVPGDREHFRPRQTVTVVDLKNLSGDDSWEYFCIGFTNDMINELSRRTDLIISAEPSTTYTRNIQQLFKRYRSDFVIIGSLMKWQDRIRLHLDIYGDGGKNLISGKNYEADSQMIFSILSRAVEDASTQLAEITGFGSIKVEDYFKTDIAAYDYYLKGKNYYQTNKPEDLRFAEQMFQKALEIDPNLAHAYSGLSDVYAFEYMAYYDRSKEKIEKAKAEALKAIETSPALPEAHRSLGRYYMFIKNYDNAEKSFLKAVEFNPKYAIGYRTLAWLKELIGDHEKAIYWAKTSLKFAPNDLETLLLLSLIHMDMRKYTVAMATLHRAIELAPDYGRAHYNLGTVYMKLGVLDLALENFSLAVKYEGDPNAHIDAGYVYLISKKYEKARTEFENSIQAGFFPFIALYLLGYMERQCGNAEAAKLYFQESIKAAKEYELNGQDNSHIKSFRAMALAGMKETDAAVSILQDLETLGQGAGDILYNVARGYALLGDAVKVAELLKRAVAEHAGPTEKEINLDPHFADFPSFSAEGAK